jgi:hypothetical protein
VADVTTRKQEQTTQTRDEPPKKQRPIQKRISVMLQMQFILWKEYIKNVSIRYIIAMTFELYSKFSMEKHV